MNHLSSDGPLEDLAEKRDRQSYEKRQLAATAREARRKEDDRIRKEDEKSDIASVTSGRRLLGGRRDSDFSLDSVSSSGGLAEATSEKQSMLAELRANLRNLESQYERALFENAELTSEKQILVYEVALLTDQLEDAEETKSELNRSFVERRRENAYLKNQVRELQHQCSYMRRQLEQRDQLIAESNCVIVGANGEENLTNGVADDSSSICPGLILVSKPLADRIQEISGNNLEEKLTCCLDDLNMNVVKVELLQNQVKGLEEEVQRCNRGQVDAEQLEKQRDAFRQLNESKYKLQESEQRITSLQADINKNQDKIIRLEGQLKRLTKKNEELEEECSTAKTDARTGKRQVRELTSECEDLRSQINSLRRNMERLRSGARTTAAT